MWSVTARNFMQQISNSTLEELESAAHMALAKFMVMSTPQMELSDRIHELEKQITVIEKYNKYVKYPQRFLLEYSSR